MKIRRLLPLVAALTLAACSADALTGPGQQLTPPAHDDSAAGSGMLGGGGNAMVQMGSGMLGGGG